MRENVPRTRRVSRRAVRRASRQLTADEIRLRQMESLSTDALQVATFLHELNGDDDGSVLQIVFLFLSYVGNQTRSSVPIFELHRWNVAVQALCRLTTALYTTESMSQDEVRDRVMTLLLDHLERLEEERAVRDNDNDYAKGPEDDNNGQGGAQTTSA